MSILKSLSSCSSADVNPEHHVKILEALIVVGGLVEIQAAPGRPFLPFVLNCISVDKDLDK